MTRKWKSPISRIILVEVLGIAFLVMFVWIMEYFDIAGTFSGMETNVADYEESAWESLAIVLAGIIIVSITRRLLHRLEYLEGLLRICSFCRKIQVGDNWVPLEQYIITHTGTVFSHGFCPECGEKHYGEYLNGNR